MDDWLKPGIPRTVAEAPSADEERVMGNVTDDERRRAALALRGVSDIGPGMTCRTGDQVLIDIAIAVGFSGACTLTDLTHRLAALMDPGAPDRIERYEMPSGDAS